LQGSVEALAAKAVHSGSTVGVSFVRWAGQEVLPGRECYAD